MSGLKDLLAELQKNYLDSIPEKIINLEMLWKSERLDELTTEYHKLKGTGRTYGLPEVTQLGEVMEYLCENQPSNPAAEPHKTLGVVVPASLLILERIRKSRVEKSSEYLLEDDAEYLQLAAFLPPPKRFAGSRSR
jgi:HPt (histidine-containing phosphotransfer) domain-containing protein